MVYRFSPRPAIPVGTLSAAPQPTFRTAGRVLRAWSPADAPALFTAYQDPAIRYWHRCHLESEEQAEEWLVRYQQDWQEEKAAHWAVLSAGSVLGRVALRRINLEDGIAECSYWVVPSARGVGVASGALDAACHWALASGFYRLELQHSVHNAASCRVAMKSGFLLEGVMRSSAVYEDGRHDGHLHARIKSAQPSESNI
ncbi:GNAT family N-acetyltransferase [Streptomyces sp. b94]|uniref:GNAT family N-acetyltransferase n=1 Tax=Streptomyces sp. b94 TaxID=1827634 RepID=UPI001B371F6C|nr:GNAT family N-acetyltransferase [Streptomyces sp. b94]MBQ1101295.1 GNAT family N-acetyltransferase [Streptomyces sp. b94]